MILVGDCLEVMRTLDANSVDAIVTDPPYGLGFMGKAWDHAVPGVPFWLEMLRVAKPGAYLVAFGGTRTFHRMACAIEDAGWELRDTLMWVYASGFPKSHNLDSLRGEVFCDCESKSERNLRPVPIPDVSAPSHAESRQGALLQPGLPEQGAPTPRRPELSGAEARRGQPGMEGRSDAEAPEGELHGRALRAGAGVGETDGASGRLHHGASACDGGAVRVPFDANGGGRSSGPQPGEQSPEELGAVSDECGSQAGRGGPVCARCGKSNPPRGLGTALKPAWEPIILARKPLMGTVAANVLAHGTGALNIDGCRVGSEIISQHGRSESENVAMAGKNYAEDSGRSWLGRWPANLIHDGSEEVVAQFPSEAGAAAPVHRRNADKFRGTYGAFAGNVDEAGSTFQGDSGSAARFFYCAKADRADRNDGCAGFEERPLLWSSWEQSPGTFQAEGTKRAATNNHPTVKPTDLMRWLCRLVTPPGGLILDPFTGSGSTGRGAILEGFRFTGIELDPNYAAIAEARIAAAVEQRRVETAQLSLFDNATMKEFADAA